MFDSWSRNDQRSLPLIDNGDTFSNTVCCRWQADRDTAGSPVADGGPQSRRIVPLVTPRPFDPTAENFGNDQGRCDRVPYSANRISLPFEAQTTSGYPSFP
jgi:hypothetical protein